MKWILIGFFMLVLSACSQTAELTAPCPNFGRYCHQTPINTWDTNSN